MKLKSFTLLFIALLATYFSYAQQHNLNCDCCKFSKNYEKNCKGIPNESRPCGCPACGEQKKKEDAARKAEDKKRNEALVARQKNEVEAKKKAEDEAYRKKMTEEKALEEKRKQEEKQMETERVKYAALLDKYKTKNISRYSTTTSNYDSSITLKYDPKDKSYQIKYLDSTITTISQNLSNSIRTISRAGGTNYFIHSEFVKTKYNSESSYYKDTRSYFIIDIWGNPKLIDGIKNFQYCNMSNGAIELYVLPAGFSKIGKRFIGSFRSASERLFVYSSEDLNAFYNQHKIRSRKWSGLGSGKWL